LAFFLLQNRYIQSLTEKEVSFPSDLILRIVLGPEDAFGIQSNSARSTAKQSEPAKLLWDANEGVSRWEGPLIEQINKVFNIGNLECLINGNILTIKAPVSSMEESENMILSVNSILPAVLSFRLRVYVWVKDFTRRRI